MKGFSAVNITFPDRLSQKELQKRILDADSAFETALLQIANGFCKQKNLQLIGLTGPTCSGKTTAAKMLTARFLQTGRTVHAISIDDFFFEKKYMLSISQNSGMEGLDYDSEKTIDTDLLQTCLSSLLAGKPTLLPHFNFFSGLRECGVQLIPQKGDLFLLEGIQVLYPNVSSILRNTRCKTLAVCPVSGITVGGNTFLPNEIRLMRRLVRDSIYRGSNASFIFSLWNNVRKNEEKNIFPYLENCDQTVDSTMPYEIGVLKPYLTNLLSALDPSDPSFETAQKMLASLRNVEPVNSNCISPNSLYREFI